MSQETRICQNCKKEFIIDEQDFAFYEKIRVPAPTFCPECRLQRRIIWRNEHNLYRRKDSRTGEMIFSTISDSASVKVYERDYWWSDKWDPMEYGRDYDFNKPFFEQIKELAEDVPWFSRSTVRLENSDYSANASDLKNCYLVFNANDNESCAYCISIRNSKDSFDNYLLHKSELCYFSFMLHDCYKAFFCSHCQNCQEIYFSYNLSNCQNCFSCVNLKNKKYHIFNKPYSKEEYFKKLEEFDIGSFKNKENILKESLDFWLKFPRKFTHGIKNSNISGDYINHSKNVLNCFLVERSEDCKYCFDLDSGFVRDSFDYSIWGNKAELVYESAMTGNDSCRIKFCAFVYNNCQDMEYCIMCHSSSNLFGCVGLKNKQYCILNKQYTKEEYERLVPRIIEQMNNMPFVDKKGRIYKYGEFFPLEISPWSYNETTTQDYFPLTKQQALDQGYTWKDPEERNVQIEIKNEDLPDHIKDVKDDIIGKVIECQHKGQCNEQCTQGFKIIPQELDFYRKMNLPLPRLCPNCRHYQRLKQRNPLKLWSRKCMCHGKQSTNKVYTNTTKHFHGDQPCPNTFQTSYSPERPEIVYCEECYKREVS